MFHCPSCDYPLPNNRERLGARCPRCKDPLYEPAGRVPRKARGDDNACPVHAGQEAVGTCARCGSFLCEICRTRWRDQIVCAACVDRALQRGEAVQGREQGHLRQGLLSVVLGATAWIAVLVSEVLGLMVVKSGKVSAAIFLLALVVLGVRLLGVLLAVVGVGLSTSALRARGSHMILATLGLILNGIYLGAFIGLFGFIMWYGT
jgi:hypothetical protein